jgi:hypothetical protein
MLIKHGDAQPIMTVVKTSEDLEYEKELAKKAKQDLDIQIKTTKEPQCS